jgi:hypothetical protein
MTKNTASDDVNDNQNYETAEKISIRQTVSAINCHKIGFK